MKKSLNYYGKKDREENDLTMIFLDDPNDKIILATESLSRVSFKPIKSSRIFQFLKSQSKICYD